MVGPTSPPAWVKPHVEKAPDGPDWLHELKLDGYRMHAHLDGAKAQIRPDGAMTGPRNIR